MNYITVDAKRFDSQVKDSKNNTLGISDSTKASQARDLEAGMAKFYASAYNGGNDTRNLKAALTAIDGNSKGARPVCMARETSRAA